MKALAAACLAALVLVPGISAQYDEVYMTCLVNAQRAQAGLDPLGIDSRLTASAQGHSNWMASAQTMSHTGAGGSSPGDRIDAAGFNWQYMGENVAYGYDTEDNVMSEWMASTGHRENILSANFNMMGSAVAYSGSTPYWTQDFGNDGSGARNIPNCNGSGGNSGNSGNQKKTLTTPQVSTPQVTTPVVSTPQITTPQITTPAVDLTPEQLGLTPIQPATNGAPSNGPTGEIIVVNTPVASVTIPANSSPASPADLAAAGLPPAPAPAPAPSTTPSPSAATVDTSDATANKVAKQVAAQSVAPSAGAPSAFASHELSAASFVQQDSAVTASSLEATHSSPFAPHALTNAPIAV